MLSGSMEPGFYRGDILFLNMGNKPIRTGEIVVFNIDGRDIPIVHRVIKVWLGQGVWAGLALGVEVVEGAVRAWGVPWGQDAGAAFLQMQGVGLGLNSGVALREARGKTHEVARGFQHNGGFQHNVCIHRGWTTWPCAHRVPCVQVHERADSDEIEILTKVGGWLPCQQTFGVEGTQSVLAAHASLECLPLGDYTLSQGF